MNAKQLNAFRAVMLSGSMVGAAKMLYVSQPAVTRLIKELEESCGFTLFERRNSRLFPTAEAEALFNEVKRHFIGLDNLTLAAEQIRMRKTGRLRIAAMPALAHSILPRVISRFMQGREDLSLTQSTYASPEVNKLVGDQLFDLGIVMLPVDNREIQYGPCYRVECELVLPPNHPLATKSDVEAKDLQDVPFIAIGEENTVMRYRIDAAFHSEGIRPKTHIETLLLTTAQALVKEGLGVSIIDPYTAYRYREEGGESRAFSPRIPFYFGFIAPLHRPFSALAEEFIRCFEELSRELVHLHPISPEEIDLR